MTIQEFVKLTGLKIRKPINKTEFQFPEVVIEKGKKEVVIKQDGDGERDGRINKIHHYKERRGVKTDGESITDTETRTNKTRRGEK